MIATRSTLVSRPSSGEQTQVSIESAFRFGTTMSRRTVSQAATYFAQIPAEERAERLAAAVRDNVDCAVSRYLLGCVSFDSGRPATAVRFLMDAFHIEPAFESASLLVFAGLNCVSKPSFGLLAVLAETWSEFRKPRFDRTRTERALLDAFDVPLPPGEALPVARLFWRLPIVVLRAELRTVMGSPKTTPLYPILSVAV